MNHKEYIIPIGEEAKEFDEMFIGVIRKQPELIRCKDCKWYEEDIGCDWGVCFHDDWTHRDVGHGVDGDGYCYRAERKDDDTDKR